MASCLQEALIYISSTYLLCTKKTCHYSAFAAASQLSTTGIIKSLRESCTSECACTRNTVRVPRTINVHTYGAWAIMRRAWAGGGSARQAGRAQSRPQSGRREVGSGAFSYSRFEYENQSASQAGQYCRYSITISTFDPRPGLSALQVLINEVGTVGTLGALISINTVQYCTVRRQRKITSESSWI